MADNNSSGPGNNTNSNNSRNSAGKESSKRSERPRRRPPAKKTNSKAPAAEPAAKAPKAAPNRALADSPVPPQLGDDHSELARNIADQLSNHSYECMVCTEVVRHSVATWSCSHCYRVFHLYCIKKWAKQEESGAGRAFRCPSCQHSIQQTPSKYKCFCGKATDPQPDGFNTPHSCGESCGKKRSRDCPHKCPLRCHPGPCPDCNLMAPAKKCPCGRTTYTHQCGKPDPKSTCDFVCDKMLSCGKHRCQEKCHHGPCKPCTLEDEVSCHCGRDDKMAPCGEEEYSCGEACGRLLRCGEHHCNVACHSGNCPPCDGDPALIVTCPCGKEPLKAPRLKCTDPIPTCGQLCSKVLMCGNHTCNLPCHTGPCQPCESKVMLTCPCGSQNGKVFCKEQADFKCHKKCKTKLSCGKHECEVICCPHRGDSAHGAHKCSRPCGKQLPCGHPCPEACHRGQCPPCMNIMTSAISCACGAEELIPPLACGTKPPDCHLPCKRERPCGHSSVPHQCHYGDCPPCMVPVEKMCAGGHKMLSAIACHAQNVSCGIKCAKPLPCGHLCDRNCHAGDCLSPITEEVFGETRTKPRVCTQACGRELPCGHKCQSKCHAATKACPRCTNSVQITCDCGTLKQSLPCHHYQQKKAALPTGMPVSLDCTDECAYQGRLAALASLGGGKAAQKAKVIYSIKSWQWAKQNLEAVQSIEKALIKFVESNDHSTSLRHMPPEKRMITHELCNVFFINCESVDKEPVRSCVLTRHSKTAQPTPLLSEAIYDSRNDPEAFAVNILSNPAKAAVQVVQMAGPHLSEIQIPNYLRAHCGNFVIVPEGDGERTDEGYVFNCVFTTKAEAGHAFSHLRKTEGLPATFRMYGEAPPPTNSSKTAATPKPKPAHADPAERPAATGGWAALLKQQQPTSAAKKRTEPAMTTSNKFAGLRR